MCIAIYKEEGYELSDEALENSWNANPDGAGFMYPDNDKVVIVKGLMSFDEFKEAYEPHKQKQAVLHFRIATHGKVDKDNTHPFQINQGLGLVHNGIMSNVKCDINKDMSDTWHFVEKIMKKYEDHLEDPLFQELIESYIGASKLITLNAQGIVSIYNEGYGKWDGANKACWFSNTSYERKTYTYTSQKNNYRGSKHQNNVWTDRDWEEAGDLGYAAIGKEYSLVFDTTCVGLNKGKTIPKGTKVRLEAFGEGAYVWVVAIAPGSTQGYRAKVTTYEINTWQEVKQLENKQQDLFTFEVGKEVIFTVNFNHFRVGDRALVTTIADKAVGIIDVHVQSNKVYMVKKEFIKPALILQ